MSVAFASPEKSLSDYWAGGAGLTGLVPSERQFIGLVPLLVADEDAEVLPPFATVATNAIINTERTNEGSIVSALWSVDISSVTYAEAKEISLATYDRFNKAGFEWARGDILDMRLESQTEPQDVDGLWMIRQAWRVLYTIEPL